MSSRAPRVVQRMSPADLWRFDVRTLHDGEQGFCRAWRAARAQAHDVYRSCARIHRGLRVDVVPHDAAGCDQDAIANAGARCAPRLQRRRSRERTAMPCAWHDTPCISASPHYAEVASTVSAASGALGHADTRHVYISRQVQCGKVVRDGGRDA